MNKIFIIIFTLLLAQICCAQNTFQSETDAYRKSYLKERGELVSSMNLPAFTDEIKNTIGWTDEEEQLNKKLHQLKKNIVTRQNYFANPWESQWFVDVKDSIESTKLFAFLQRMPKGAILHSHPGALGNYADLLETAANYSNDNKSYYVNYDSLSNFFSLTDAPGKGYKSVKSEFKNNRGKLLSYLTITSQSMQFKGDIWELFEPVFTRVSVLFDNKEIVYNYFHKTFKYLVEIDNLDYLEIRSGWKLENESNPETIEYNILRALKDVQKNYPYFDINIIQVAMRHSIDEQYLDRIRDEIIYVGRALQENPNSRVRGYDLVGEEDIGYSTFTYLDKIAEAFDSLDGYLPPFYFHDGESDLPPDYTRHANDTIPAKTYTNNNVLDAYLLSQMNIDGFTPTIGRVGHGIALYKSPLLMNKYNEIGLCVELNPISNQLLRYMEDLRDHPGQTYLAMGIPVTLNPDDPAIFGYEGVTHDFWEACIAWNLDLRALKLLSYYSLQYSSLPEKSKNEKIKLWKQHWYSFIEGELSE